MRIDTNVDFVSVTWTAGSHEWTENNTSTTSVFSYAYNNMGSTDGNSVTVRAVVRDAAGNEDAAEKTITVWKPIRIQSMPFQSSFAVGEEFNLTLNTNIPYHTVRWYDGEELIDEDTSGGTQSRVPHKFVSGDGSPEDGGRIHTIRATVFLNEPESEETNLLTTWRNLKTNEMPRDASSDSWTRDVHVYEDLGLLWRYVDLSLVSVSSMGNNTYSFTTTHTVWYYNDKPGTSTAFMRGKATWYHKGNGEGGVWVPIIGQDENGEDLVQGDHPEKDETIPSNLTFWDFFQFSTMTWTDIQPNSFHAVEGYTNLGGIWDNAKGANGSQIQLPAILEGALFPDPPSIPSSNYEMREPPEPDGPNPPDRRADGLPFPRD